MVNIGPPPTWWGPSPLLALSARRFQLSRAALAAWLWARHIPSLFVALALTFGFWWLLQPTVFSRDAFYMLRDASLGRFGDMHPLLIPILLSWLLRLGGNVGLVTLAQLALGFLGIRRLVLAVLRFVGEGGPAVADMACMAIMLLLASPLTPLSIYLATLWSDTWLAIILLWALALLLELWDASTAPPSSVKLAAVVILLSLILLVRYNAVIIYPVLALAFVIVLRRVGRPRLPSIGLALLPIVLAGGFTFSQYRTHPIASTHPADAVLALDLGSMIVADRSICQNLSIQACDLVRAEFTPAFKVGDGAIDVTFTQANQFQYRPFLNLFYFPRLRQEYVMAALEHPGLLISVKWLNFIDYIGPDPHQYFFQSRIIPEDHRLLPTQAFVSPDGLWFQLTRAVMWSPVLMWASFVHAVWLGVAALLLAGTAALARARHSARWRFLFVLMLAPAAYYFAHLLALTTAEFRFMYPATLLTQVMALSLAVAGGIDPQLNFSPEAIPLRIAAPSHLP